MANGQIKQNSEFDGEQFTIDKKMQKLFENILRQYKRKHVCALEKIAEYNAKNRMSLSIIVYFLQFF